MVWRLIMLWWAISHNDRLLAIHHYSPEKKPTVKSERLTITQWLIVYERNGQMPGLLGKVYVGVFHYGLASGRMDPEDDKQQTFSRLTVFNWYESWLAKRMIKSVGNSLGKRATKEVIGVV